MSILCIFHGKCRTVYRALPMKLFYQNGDSAPDAFRRFRALKNIRRCLMTSNETLPEIKDSIFRPTFNIFNNLLRVEHTDLRLQTVFNNHGQHTEQYLS